MAAVAIAGVGIMMVCCSSSSVASLMMGDEEKKVPDGNDAAGEAQAKADAVAADPNSTPEEVATAQAEADTAQAEADTNSGPQQGVDRAAAEKKAAEEATAKKAAEEAAAALFGPGTSVAKAAWMRDNCEPCHRIVRCEPPSNECYGCFNRNKKKSGNGYPAGTCPLTWDPCPDAPEGACPR